ncbi:MAG: hypothetical protein QXV37_02800 [Candidatus Jordarchaeaceae archaeon]
MKFLLKLMKMEFTLLRFPSFLAAFPKETRAEALENIKDAVRVTLKV